MSEDSSTLGPEKRPEKRIFSTHYCSAQYEFTDALRKRDFESAFFALEKIKRIYEPNTQNQKIIRLGVLQQGYKALCEALLDKPPLLSEDAEDLKEYRQLGKASYLTKIFDLLREKSFIDAGGFPRDENERGKVEESRIKFLEDKLDENENLEEKIEELKSEIEELKSEIEDAEREREDDDYLIDNLTG